MSGELEPVNERDAVLIPEGISKWDLEAWITRLGSMPVQKVAWEDFSESYEMCRAHVWRLENGQYALITESGCSCYEPEDADIDLFPNKRRAMESFDNWVRENSR